MPTISTTSPLGGASPVSQTEVPTTERALSGSRRAADGGLALPGSVDHTNAQGKKRRHGGDHPPPRSGAPGIWRASPSASASGSGMLPATLAAGRMHGTQALAPATHAAATPAAPTLVQAPARPDDLRFKTPLSTWERDWFDFAIDAMPAWVQSVETEAKDGSRWLKWPLGLADTGARPDRARLLIDAAGVWHRITTFEPKPHGAGDHKTEVQLGRRLNNAQWLEKTGAVKPPGPEPRGDLPFSKHFIALLGKPEGRVSVASLNNLGSSPLVELLTSMAGRGFPVQQKFAGALPGIAVTVATLRNLKRSQLLSVIEALQDDDGNLSLDLGDLRHLPGNVSCQVINRLKEDKYKSAARALMSLIQRASEPMGATAWGTTYSGAPMRDNKYVNRYALSDLLIRSFEAENGNHVDRTGAATAMRILENELGHSETLPWSTIERISKLSHNGVTNRLISESWAFIRFIEANQATLKARYENPPTNTAEERHLAWLLTPKPLEGAELAEDLITIPRSPLHDLAEALRVKLNVGLARDPRTLGDLRKKLAAFCELMKGLAKPWANEEHSEYAEFKSQIVTQHNLDIARGDTSRSLHHFLELPRATQTRFVTGWTKNSGQAARARSVLNSEYKLGLAIDGNLTRVDPPSIQIHRDMQAAVPMSVSNKLAPANHMFFISEGGRPTEESLIMQLADRTLVDHLIPVPIDPQSESKFPEFEARERLAQYFGHYDSLSYLRNDLEKLSDHLDDTPYDPPWRDSPSAHADPDPPRQPRLVNHIELAREVLAKVRENIVARTPFADADTDADTDATTSADYIAARNAVVEWLNFVESKMHNKSYDATLRIVVGKPSKEEFFARVSADLRASANAVSRLPAPSPPRPPVEPISVRTLTLEEMIGRRAMFVDRMRYLADRLDHDEDGPVRLAFSTLHDIASAATEPVAAPTDGEANEALPERMGDGGMIVDVADDDLPGWPDSLPSVSGRS